MLRSKQKILRWSFELAICKLPAVLLILLIGFGFLLPAKTVEGTGSEAGNFSIQLNEGWNLLSVPNWAEEVSVEAGDIKAWVTYQDGTWVSGGSLAALEGVLYNPAQAVYIKAIRPTRVRFTWSELRPDRQFASQPLVPGWNLISSSLRADYMTILANLRDDGNQGLTHIYAQNNYNSRKEAGYYLTWAQERNSLANTGQANLYDMYPFDGYWVYLRGEAVTYSTPVSGELPE